MIIVTEPRLSADGADIWWTLDWAQRQELIDWLTRRGFNEGHIVAVQRETVDCPLVHVTMTDEPLRLNADGEDFEYVHVDVLDDGGLPDWWVI